jgi:thiamine biosynthesis protein ThiS
MRVTVKLYGNLKRYLPEKKETAEMEIESGTTIRALLAQLGVPDSDVWMSAVNDQVVDDSTALRDGDVLEVFEPVGGGAKRSRHAESSGASHCNNETFSSKR